MVSELGYKKVLDSKMGLTKFKMECFNGNGDFYIWRQWMRAILMQQKMAMALLDASRLPKSMPATERNEMLKMANNTIILHFNDNPLRQVLKETLATGVWSKLESLYITKSLTNRIYLKVKFFLFKMQEDQAVIMLNSLPSTYG